MGALQVPRVGAALAAAAAVVLVAAAGSPAWADEAVAIVDLRAGPTADQVADHTASRRALAAALDARPGIAMIAGARADALAGLAVDADDDAAASALTEAREAFGSLECGRARPAAEDAVLLLAGRHAAGLDERVRLGAAWTYVLLCADRDQDGPMARSAADRLRALGGAAAVPADVWAKYPDIDAATDRDIVELDLRGGDGATLEVDHVRGDGAGRRFVAAGKHVVAAARGTVRGATFVTVLGKPLTVEVPVSERAGEWRGLAASVAAWQGAAPPSAAELTELMTKTGVRFAVVLGTSGAKSLWVRGPDEPVAHRAEGTFTDAAALGDAVTNRVSVWTEGGPDPDRPLLTEADVAPRGGRGAKTEEPARWWVYAVIGGALAAGAVTLYALDAGDDRQRIELTFP